MALSSALRLVERSACAHIRSLCCSGPDVRACGHAASRSHAAAAAAGGDTQQQRVALIQGASRGLGLEYTRQLLQRPGQSVVATCRDPDGAQDLRQLAAQHSGQLSIVQLDATDQASIQDAAAQVSASHQHLDLLINVAGLLHIPGEMSPETALSRLEAENLQRVFAVNTFGPILVSKAFAPLLINAAKANGASEERPAVVANMSARVGSIGDNGMGGWYSYRASKTALNQLTKTMAVEFGRRKQKNVKPEKLFTRERAVRQLLGLIDGATLADNGSYWAWDGQTIPW